MSENYEVIFCIVNAGYSSMVMDAARAEGAGGGTVLHARGTANKEAEKYFGITIQPEKEIVMILVPFKIKDAVLHALYRNVGLNSAGQGIAFSMSAESVVGISERKPQHTETETAAAANTDTNPDKEQAAAENAATAESGEGETKQ